MGHFSIWFLLGAVFLVTNQVLVVAQDFNVPDSWTIPDSVLSQSYQNRSRSANDAIGQLTSRFDYTAGIIPKLDQTSSQMAELITILALNDWIRGDTTYKSDVSNYISAYRGVQPNFFNLPGGLNSDILAWGLAHFHAYRAYHVQPYLDTAIQLWDGVYQDFVTEAEASGGRHSTRNSTFSPQCSGASTAGAVFQASLNPNDYGANGETVGPFIALSAYLSEATLNSTYSSAANLTAEFVFENLYKGSIIQDNIDLAACRLGTTPFTYDSGFVIEGLSVLVNGSVNHTWTKFMEDLISSAVPYPAWTNTDGVIYEAVTTNPDDYINGHKGNFIRGLHEAWLRWDPSHEMATFIAAFITVQLNSILSNDMSSNHTIGPSWPGPVVEDSTFHPYPQITGVQMLNAGLSLARANATLGKPATQSSAIPSSTSTSTGSPSSSHTGAIAGGVVGGVVGVVAIVLLSVFLVHRRKNQATHNPSGADGVKTVSSIDPFVSDPSELPIVPRGGKRSEPSTASFSAVPPSASSAVGDSTLSSSLLAPNQQESRGPAMQEVASQPDADGVPPVLRRFMEEIRSMVQSGRDSQDHAPPAYAR